MQDFTPVHLRTLLDDAETARLSAYLPMIRAGDTQQNTIRLKNLLRGAHTALEAAGMDKREAARIVGRLDEETSGTGVAEHQSEGLAVFASPDACLLLRCRRDFAPLLTVAEHYHLLPLLPLAGEHRRYWILAVSRECTRLISACRDRGEEYDLTGTDVPRRLTDVVGREVEDQSLQFHSKQRDGHAIYHAQGRGEDDELPELERYCRELGTAVAQELNDPSARIVLAGDVRLTSLFQHVVDDLNVYTPIIRGNHDDTPADDLAAEGWTIAATATADEEAALKARFEHEVGRNRATDSEEVIADAAAEGRVDVLLLDERILSESPQSRPPDSIRHGGRAPGAAEETANRAVLATLRHGGSARMLAAVPMPTDAPMAAVLRY